MITYFIITFVACAIAGFFVWLLPEKWRPLIHSRIRKKWRSLKERFRHKETPEEAKERMLQERYPPAEVESNGEDDDEDDE